MSTTRRAVLLSSLAGVGVAGMAHGQQAAAPAAGAAAAGATAAAGGRAGATAAAPAASADASVIAGIPVNYDEAKTGTYVLPDPFKMNDGTPVTTAAAWNSKRRPEIVGMFESEQYGKAPGKPTALNFEVFETGMAFDGKAKRKQVRITFTPDKSGPVLNLLVYTPTAATKPSPTMLSISFFNNAASVPQDSAVVPTATWNAAQKARVMAPARGAGAGAGRGAATAPATPAGGAATAARGPAGPSTTEQMLNAGYGFATFYYGDIDPDDFNAVPYGIRALYLKPGKKYPETDEWGSISAWAWGISRVIDYFETDKDVDAKKVAIYGVSRLGKTVMWAGAHDTRIAATIASCSGEGGAALSRRNFGETISHLMAPTRFPYQFAQNWARYAYHPEWAPMDANLLVALHAPRPLLLQTGSTDNWSDPHGEFLSAVDAGRVYSLLGKQGLGTDVWPKATVPIIHDLSYYMHDGGHGALPSDWPIYIQFLDAHLKQA